MTSHLEHLGWDSEHFGLPVAKVLAPDPHGIETAVAEADGAGVRCLTALVPAAETETAVVAERAGFRCYDIRVELARGLEALPHAGERHAVRPASPSEVDRLEPLAASSFVTSRFYADPHFPRPAVAKLYAAWLRRGTASPSRTVLTVDGADGFVICHCDEQRAVGTIELIAVAEALRGRGLGTAFIRAAEALFARKALKRARVVTQGANLPAQRLYQGSGYRTSDVALWFHRWMPG
jgi:dTDP-4-amino-4,6-dideoxy-D-galactose acyltransferase